MLTGRENSRPSVEKARAMQAEGGWLSGKIAISEEGSRGFRCTWKK
jgi:hypothetical protein